MITIQIKKYDPIAFIFAEAYLAFHHDRWYGVPRNRVEPHLPEPSFLKDLDNGNLDFDEYDITFTTFDWQDFFRIEDTIRCII